MAVFGAKKALILRISGLENVTHKRTPTGSCMNVFASGEQRKSPPGIDDAVCLYWYKIPLRSESGPWG